MNKKHVFKFFVLTMVVLLMGCSTPKQEKSFKITLKEDLVLEDSDENEHQNFSFIRALDVDKKGNIYMVDKRKTLKFDKFGKFLWALEQKGQGPGEFQRVVDIALSNDGKVILADQNSRKIMIFSDKGEFIDEFKIKEGMPFIIDTDSKGYIYAVFLEDTTGFLLHKYSRDGKLLNSFLEEGYKDEKEIFIRSAKNEITFCIGRNDNIYISCKYEYKILKYNTDGQLIKKWTRQLPYKPKKMKVVQPQPGWVSLDADQAVQDISVDSQNNVYVIWGCRPAKEGYIIDVFSSEGQFKGYFYSGVEPEEDVPFQFIHIDHFDKLYVMKSGAEPKVIRFNMIPE